MKAETYVLGSAKREAACVSSYEWADVCVMRQTVSQNSASSERMRLAPACWENEKRREGTAPLHWGLVFSGGGWGGEVGPIAGGERADL